MKVLITGAGGFVAPYAARAFATRFPGVALVGTSLGGGPHPGFPETFALDVGDGAAIVAALETVRPTHVLHLAGVAAPRQANDDPQAAWRINLMGTLALGRAILRVSPQTILLNAGSGLAYGDTARRDAPLDEDAAFAPLDDYAATKAAADLALGALARGGLRVARLRPFNHTGAGQSEDYAIPAFAAQIAAIEAGRRAPALHVGDLEAQRDFCDVADVAEAYALTAEAATQGRIAPGRAFNLCSGRALPMRALLDMLLAMSPARIEVERDPARARPADIARMVGDPTRAAAELGWRAAIPLERTLAAALDAQRARLI